MNRRMIIYITGRIFTAEAILLLLPTFVSLAYREEAAFGFVCSAAIALVLGFLLSFKRPKNTAIYASEGFIVVALAWIGMSFIGALPFYINGEIPSFIDCLFETVSGFTTTGSTILSDVEALSRGAIFWRSFTNWIGGMGVLVFVMAVIPLAGKRSMHLMRAEVPGPVVGKLVPKLADTAKILYGIYFALSFIEVIFLLCGGLSLFDSVVHTFSTAGTGGFSSYNSSVAYFNSAYVEIVITVFMALFGINFNLFFFLIVRNFKGVLKNEELRLYLCLIFASITVVTLNILPLYESTGSAIRHAAFQVSSIITTTGFSTANFEYWPHLSRVVLLLLMFCGATSGSTGGGIKCSRIILLFRLAKYEIQRLRHPRTVGTVKLEGKVMSDQTLGAVSAYFIIYIIIFAFSLLLLSFESFSFETNFSAVAEAINNVGPGLGAVGPAHNFAGYSAFSKIILSFDMLVGRLEIFPVLLALSPASWRRKS